MNYDIKSMLENKSENLCLTNENYYSKIISDFDNPIHNIAYRTIYSFVNKFPKICVNLIHILA